MSFLDINGKTFLVAGVANRKSIAFVVSQLLESEGARVIYSVRSQKRKDELQKYLKESTILIYSKRHAPPRASSYARTHTRVHSCSA